MRPSEALAKHRDEVLAIIAKYPVSNARVFGSVARGEDTEGSDIDIIVDAGNGCSYYDFFRMEDDFALLLNVKVDIHTLAEFGQTMRQRVERDMKAL